MTIISKNIYTAKTCTQNIAPTVRQLQTFFKRYQAILISHVYLVKGRGKGYSPCHTTLILPLTTSLLLLHLHRIKLPSAPVPGNQEGKWWNTNNVCCERKRKVCQDCKDSGERPGEWEWKERTEDVWRKGGGANDRCFCKFFILHRLLGKLLGRALNHDFTTNPVCKLLFIFCKVCQTQALIFPPEFPLVARSCTCSPHNLWLPLVLMTDY